VAVIGPSPGQTRLANVVAKECGKNQERASDRLQPIPGLTSLASWQSQAEQVPPRLFHRNCAAAARALGCSPTPRYYVVVERARGRVVGWQRIERVSMLRVDLLALSPDRSVNGLRLL
jgi:hypothetical protein